MDRYSNLVRVGRDHDLLLALQVIEPRLQGLVVLTDGGVPRLWVELRGGTLLPIENMGDGVGRELLILTTIAASRDGVVLIDEVENGIHHVALRQFWSSIAAFADTVNCQVFATTHSRECIEAAFEEFTESQSASFVLQRLYRKGDSIRAEAYEGEKLSAALETGFEVR